jgi:hypothetical protein
MEIKILFRKEFFGKMKKLLKFSGICAAVIALVGFILLMTTPIIEYHNGDTWTTITGGVFGGGQSITHALGVTGDPVSIDATLAWTGLVGWILMLVAILILIAGFVLPLLKVTALEKFAGVLNLVAVIALVVAGILVFISRPVFWAANEMGDSTDHWGLGIGWIFAGILAIVGGCLAILPAALDFIGSKKK